VGDEIIEHPLAAGTPRPSEQALNEDTTHATVATAPPPVKEETAHA
jgi:hypothetical protein